MTCFVIFFYLFESVKVLNKKAIYFTTGIEAFKAETLIHYKGE